jgi:hypothetical protein
MKMKCVGGPYSGREFEVETGVKNLSVAKMTPRRYVYKEAAGPAYRGLIGTVFDEYVYRVDGDKLVYEGVEVRPPVDDEYTQEIETSGTGVDAWLLR